MSGVHFKVSVWIIAGAWLAVSELDRKGKTKHVSLKSNEVFHVTKRGSIDWLLG